MNGSNAAVGRAIPPDVRSLLDAPNMVHLSTLRKNGWPRNWVVWVGLEGDHVLICTSNTQRKAVDMRRNGRVGLSVVDLSNPTGWLPRRTRRRDPRRP